MNPALALQLLRYGSLVVLTTALFQAMYGLDPAHIWTAIVVGHATRATLSVARFRQGKWRSIAVDIEPARP